MDNQKINTKPYVPPKPRDQASAAPTAEATAVSDFDALASAMAEQGLFGKIRMGASLLLFGEAKIPANDKFDG